MNRRFATLTLLFVALPCTAFASEKAIDKSAVPKPVMEAVATNYPKAKVTEAVTETEGTRTLYEIRLLKGSERVDVKLDESGKLIAEERTIDLKTVPAAVLDASQAGPNAGWKIKHVEKVDNMETPTESGFEVLLQKSGQKKREVLFTRDGKFLKDEEDDDEK